MDRLPTLLLVEDDATSARFLSDVLGQLPAQVVVAGSIREALACAGREVRFAAWLVDANLPDGGGEELLGQLHARLGDTTPALALTADALPARHQRLRAAGFDAVLVKPLPAAELLAAVAPLLPSRARQSPRLWDEAQALRAAGGDARSVAALRQLFLAELPLQRRTITAAFTTGDHATLQSELHRLKASCGFVGASGLLEAVRGLSTAPGDADRLRAFEQACESSLAGD